MIIRSALKYFLAASSLMLSLCWLASAQSITTQPTSDSSAWGDAVNGVQLHLAVATNLPPFVAPSHPGDLPHLQLEMRNIGAGSATFSCHIGQTSEIEIDGVWYEPGGFFETGTCANPPPLASGQNATVLLALQTVVVNGKSVAFDGFHVGPGKHVVRVRTPSKSFGVEDSAHNLITLVSNSITVETPSATESGEAIATQSSNASESDALAWGNPVNGIQLRLVATSAQLTPRPPGEWPYLLFPGAGMQIRNVGTETATFNACGCGIPILADIQIDGAWYTAMEITMTGSTPAYVIPPHKQSEDIAIGWGDAHGFAIDGKSSPLITGKIIGFDDLNLRSGKHTVRVRLSAHVKGSDAQASTTITLVSKCDYR